MPRPGSRRLAVLGLVGAALTGVAALLLAALNAVAWVLLATSGPEPGAEQRAREPDVQAALREVYAHLSADEMDLLLEENVLAVPGRGFGFPGHFRLAFCVDEQVIARSGPAFARAAEKARR